MIEVDLCKDQLNCVTFNHNNQVVATGGNDGKI